MSFIISPIQVGATFFNGLCWHKAEKVTNTVTDGATDANVVTEWEIHDGTFLGTTSTYEVGVLCYNTYDFVYSVPAYPVEIFVTLTDNFTGIITGATGVIPTVAAPAGSYGVFSIDTSVLGVCGGYLTITSVPDTDDPPVGSGPATLTLTGAT